jgi:hypothetical protein
MAIGLLVPARKGNHDEIGDQRHPLIGSCAESRGGSHLTTSTIGVTPPIFSSRVKLQTSRCRTISVATSPVFFVRTCVAPTHILIVSKGRSIVSRHVGWRRQPFRAPPREATVPSRRALSFDWAGVHIGPIAPRP